MEEGLGESTASLRTPSAIKKLVSLQEMCIIGIGQTGWAEKNEDVSTKRYSSDPTRFLLSTHYQSFALCDRQMYSGYDSDSDSIPTF